MVDLPEPDSPVNHSTAGFWFFSAACASRLMSSACQWTFCARRRVKWSMPAATVALVILSIRMKPPSVAVVGIGFEHDRPVGREFGDADGVQLQRLGRQMLQRVDVDLVFGLAGPSPTRSACRASANRRGRAAAARRPSRRWSPRTGRRPRGGSSAAAITSPREQSTSSARSDVTDWPATASSRSPSKRDDRA